MIETDALLAELDAARKTIEQLHEESDVRDIEIRNIKRDLDATRREIGRLRTDALRRDEEIASLVESLKINHETIVCLKATMPCGHSRACVVIGAEGTQYCGACEGQNVIADGVRSECETLAAFALSDARAREAKWRQRFERLKAFFYSPGPDEDWAFEDEYGRALPRAVRQQELNAILGEGDE